MAMTPPKAGHAPRPAESPAVIAHLNLVPAVALMSAFAGMARRPGSRTPISGTGC
jgi:hypothetical protein